MATGYRAIFRLETGEDAVTVAESQLRSWFREKLVSNGRGALAAADWEGIGRHALGSDANLFVVHDDHPADSSQRRLYRFVERNSAGTWRVSIYAFSLPNSRDFSQTLVVEAGLDGTDEEDALRKVDPPRIARHLLDTAAVRDGNTMLYGKPRLVRQDGIDEVVAALVDPDRTASVIVAASPGPEVDHKWAQIIESLTKKSVGVATTFVVTHAAVEELNARLTPSHAAEFGRVRTYAPDVALHDPEDGLKHRILGPATLARTIRGTRVSGHLPYIHAESARRRFIVSALPSDVRRGIELLKRAETEAERAVLVTERLSRAASEDSSMAPLTEGATDLIEQMSASGVGTDTLSPSLASRVARMVRRWLRKDLSKAEDLDELEGLFARREQETVVALEQLNGAVIEQSKLDADNALLRRRVEDLEIEATIESISARQFERQARFYRERLIEAQRFEDLVVTADDTEWEAPESVQELVTRLTGGQDQHPAFTRVVFTGDESRAIEIDKRDQLGRYAAALWDHVQVLFAYAEHRIAGRFDGNVHQYLTRSDAPPGHKTSPQRHAASESESVLSNSAWRAERVLPVPTSVSETGYALMAAHFKPTHADTFAPRLHYYDDVLGSGKIYVGYIGRHLTNTKS